VASGCEKGDIVFIVPITPPTWLGRTGIYRPKYYKGEATSPDRTRWLTKSLDKGEETITDAEISSNGLRIQCAEGPITDARYTLVGVTLFAVTGLWLFRAPCSAEIFTRDPE